VEESNPQLERRVVRAIQNDPFESSKRIKEKMNFGVPENEVISDRTMRRIAQVKGLMAHRPAFKRILTLIQKARRLEFAKTYAGHDMRYWSHVIFTDETRLELHSMDRRQRVRRPLHKRYQIRYVARGPKGKALSVMFWSCVLITMAKGTLFLLKGC